jgi:hypothetical protein
VAGVVFAQSEEFQHRRHRYTAHRTAQLRDSNSDVLPLASFSRHSYSDGGL